MSSNVSGIEELQRGIQNLNFRTKELINRFTTEQSDYKFDEELINESEDRLEDDGWEDLGDLAEVPTEDHVSKYRCVHGERSIGLIGVGSLEQYLVAAINGGATTCEYAYIAAKFLAANAGWIMHCKTVEDAVRKVMEKYPSVKELKDAYDRGRENAMKESQKRYLLQSDEEGAEIDEFVGGKFYVSERDRFAGFESVPVVGGRAKE